MKNVVYCAAVTEYESGWGNRPDGVLIGISKEAFDAKAKEINSHKGEEFSRTETVFLTIVTDECYKALLASENGTLWLSQSQAKNQVVGI